MPDSQFEAICQYARTLNIEPFAAELAQFSHDNNLSEENLHVIEAVFRHMAQLKNEAVVTTLLRTSRLPLKNPKAFENFDFSRLRGRNIDRLTNLPALTAVYAHRNLAFIGPQGVGKTHLAMAYGRACCEKDMKAFFLKASELNHRLLDARRMDRCCAAINFFVKPSCLIIDEVGRCVFDKVNTQLFFDLIDRRYSKEGTSCMIFTSNRQPDTWSEYFSGDSDLLCALDRIFDDASVFIIKDDSYRSQKLETIKLETGPAKPGLGY